MHKIDDDGREIVIRKIYLHATGGLVNHNSPRMTVKITFLSVLIMSLTSSAVSNVNRAYRMLIREMPKETKRMFYILFIAYITYH